MRKGDYIWIALLMGLVAGVTLPVSHSLFIKMTSEHPFLMGFLKFSILATMGEFLALRIVRKRYEKPSGLVSKTIIWGLIGVLVVLMFPLFSMGVAGAMEKGYLPVGSGFWGSFLSAFLTSTIMNLTFGPVFMAAHRVSDTFIEAHASGESLTLDEVVDRVDWLGFIKFVVGKTIPYFWIPAHTITFLLPGEYRVLVAAFLSIALGAILSFAKTRVVQ